VPLDVRTDTRDDLVLVVLAGELDIYTVAGFRQEIETIDLSGNRMVIDLNDVTLIDSSGLGALVSLLNQTRSGSGQLGLVCPHRRLRRVFEITGLRRAFVFGDDVDEVRTALDAEREAAQGQ
jgi:anti-sigma B factor antagonist